MNYDIPSRFATYVDKQHHRFHKNYRKKKLSNKPKIHAAMLMSSSGKILSMGTNIWIDGNDKIFSIHAEDDCISNFFKRLKSKKDKKRKCKSLTMVVVRISDDSFRMSRPCSKCQKLIKKHKFIREVIYSTDEMGVWGKEKNN